MALDDSLRRAGRKFHCWMENWGTTARAGEGEDHLLR